MCEGECMGVNECMSMSVYVCECECLRVSQSVCVCGGTQPFPALPISLVCAHTHMRACMHMDNQDGLTYAGKEQPVGIDY